MLESSEGHADGRGVGQVVVTRSDTNQMTWSLVVTCCFAFRGGGHCHNTHLPLKVPTSDDQWAWNGGIELTPLPHAGYGGFPGGGALT